MEWTIKLDPAQQCVRASTLKESETCEGAERVESFNYPCRLTDKPCGYEPQIEGSNPSEGAMGG